MSKKVGDFFDMLKWCAAYDEQHTTSICQRTTIFQNEFPRCMGELEGAKPSSNEIECLAKPCIARRATGAACTFAAHCEAKVTAFLKCVKKVGDFFDTLRTECSTFAWNTPSSLWVYFPFYRHKLGKKGGVIF